MCFNPGQERRVPSPNRYIAVASFCFCKNNKRLIINRNIALEYSSVHKGLVGTVLCIETSTTNNGAVISEFSQYPGEEETVWNACSFLQHLPCRDEVVLPMGDGVVRIYHVLVSANSRAETVGELEGLRKRLVVQVLDTIYADVCHAVDTAVRKSLRRGWWRS